MCWCGVFPIGYARTRVVSNYRRVVLYIYSIPVTGRDAVRVISIADLTAAAKKYII